MRCHQFRSRFRVEKKKTQTYETFRVWQHLALAGLISGSYTGTLSMDIVGQPVKMTANFSLEPAGKGCVYRIQHRTTCSIPLVGGPVAKFAQGQVEAGCADLCLQGDFTVEWLADYLDHLAADAERRASMRAKARALSVPDAAARLADVVEHSAF